MKKSVSLALMILMLPFYLYASDYYVDAVNGSNDNSGTSKDDAWKTITYALTKIEGTEAEPAIFHIAEGLYNIENGEDFPIEMKDNLKIIGEDRDLTILDAGYQEDTSVIYFNNVHFITIENLTITGGTGLPITESYHSGGGIFCIDSSPIVKNCLISRNMASRGGGIYLNNSSPSFIACIIRNNDVQKKEQKSYQRDVEGAFNPEAFPQTYYGYPGIYAGGGIYCEENSSPTIDKCIITGNIATYGGGINSRDSSPTFLNCEIKENYANSYYGTEDPWGNKIRYIPYGGGLFFWGDDSTPTITNCFISFNSTDAGYGSGILCYYDESLEITNCTFYNNKRCGGSSVRLYSSGANVKIKNSIIWGEDGSWKYEIMTGDDYGVFIKLGENIDIMYSCLQGIDEGEGNIGTDPMFITGPWGDYYLSSIDTGQEVDSPCFDAGNSDPPLGFDYQWRTTRTDGIFDTDRIDMGYHYPSHVQFDLNIEPDKDSFKEGDNISLTTDITTAPYEKDILVDIYFVMLNPEGNIYSYPRWDMGIQPAVENLPLPANLALNDVSLLEITLPSEKPPIKDPGTYTFAIAATKPDTVNFISNIATISFCVE